MTDRPGLVVGVDASRNRSGGAKAHLVGLLQEGNPTKHGICEVHVWAYQALADALPNATWLVKHVPRELARSLPTQIWWQRIRLPREILEAGCSIVLNTDAGTVLPFRPSVTMSRDMLSYEAGEMRRYGVSKARLRLAVLRLIQARSLRRSDGVIFLTNHAAQVIQGITGQLHQVAIIPHGVGTNFKHATAARAWPAARERSIRCVYVSNVAPYKHQWVVVRAIAQLRTAGYELVLELVGGGSGRAQRMLDDEIAQSDPHGVFVTQLGHVSPQDLPGVLANADLFVFASSCENMPITLVEGMTVGLPIACSNRGPMPEILADAGVYFDPETAYSVAAAIEKLISDAELRSRVAQRARQLSSSYSWARCADETWAFVREVGERPRPGCTGTIAANN